MHLLNVGVISEITKNTDANLNSVVVGELNIGSTGCMCFSITPENDNCGVVFLGMTGGSTQGDVNRLQIDFEYLYIVYVPRAFSSFSLCLCLLFPPFPFFFFLPSFLPSSLPFFLPSFLTLPPFHSFIPSYFFLSLIPPSYFLSFFLLCVFVSFFLDIYFNDDDRMLREHICLKEQFCYSRWFSMATLIEYLYT